MAATPKRIAKRTSNRHDILAILLQENKAVLSQEIHLTESTNTDIGIHWKDYGFVLLTTTFALNSGESFLYSIFARHV
jgi:hypothetical protein